MLLLEAKANPNLSSLDKTTIADTWRVGHHGVGQSVRRELGKNAMHYAFKNRNSKIIDALIAYGASFDSKSCLSEVYFKSQKLKLELAQKQKSDSKFEPKEFISYSETQKYIYLLQANENFINSTVKEMFDPFLPPVLSDITKGYLFFNSNPSKKMEESTEELKSARVESLVKRT